MAHQDGKEDVRVDGAILANSLRLSLWQLFDACADLDIDVSGGINETDGRRIAAHTDWEKRKTYPMLHISTTGHVKL